MEPTTLWPGRHGASLLTAPLEVRLLIYHHVFRSATISLTSDTSGYHVLRHKNNRAFEICLANKQIYHECLPLWFNNLTITMDWKLIHANAFGRARLHLAVTRIVLFHAERFVVTSYMASMCQSHNMIGLKALLGSMPSLRNLEMDIHESFHPDHRREGYWGTESFKHMLDYRVIRRKLIIADTLRAFRARKLSQRIERLECFDAGSRVICLFKNGPSEGKRVFQTQEVTEKLWFRVVLRPDDSCYQ